MALFKGNSKEVFGENVRTMKNAGHSEPKALAAAMKSAGTPNPFAKKKKTVVAKPRKMSEIADNLTTMEPSEPGQKPITFKKGGLHASTGVKPGQKIPAAKHAAAKAGKFGKKAQKQEDFYENVLS